MLLQNGGFVPTVKQRPGAGISDDLTLNLTLLSKFTRPNLFQQLLRNAAMILEVNRLHALCSYRNVCAQSTMHYRQDA